ncbi:MAG: hypothetical protein JRN42_05865 [Nitrososphaerota archaeon]|nr:hypothetical protein [Nitrososphaerota archaeon]
MTKEIVIGAAAGAQAGWLIMAYDLRTGALAGAAIGAAGGAIGAVLLWRGGRK